MLRVLAKAWGRDSQQWIGRHAKIYNEPTVKYGGKEVGGIRIRALTDIDKNGVQFSLAVARNKREPFLVQLLEVETTPYPDDKFNQALPVMVEKMQSGEWTLQQVIARCQQTGALSQEQLSKLEEAAPTIIEDNNDAEPI